VNPLAWKRAGNGRAGFAYGERLALRRHVPKPPVQQTIDLRLEGHDAAGHAEDNYEGAGYQRRIEMQIEQELAHAITLTWFGTAGGARCGDPDFHLAVAGFENRKSEMLIELFHGRVDLFHEVFSQCVTDTHRQLCEQLVA
jgi:hypothetical protein